jgi:ClpP class serine protease
MSAALDKEGVKVSLISKGKYKTEGNPYEPLTDEGRAAIQERVNEYYDAFVNAVARNRGVKPTSVRNGYGEGRVVGASQALEMGMVDRIGTLDETVNRLFGLNSMNVPEAAASSEPLLTEDMQREAQTLRERVQSILKETNNA